MDFDGIPPVGSSEVTPGVNQRSQSGKGGGERPGKSSNSEPEPRAENQPSEEVEFSALDPVVGLILAEVTPAACGTVAKKVKEILPD
jgi:hypothetical protein